MQYELAGGKCEICGQSGIDQGFKHPLECHEEWNYNEDTKTQKLIRLVALCPRCHQVKHFGRTDMIGGKTRDEAYKHLRAVNEWTREEALAHIQVSYQVWQNRSSHEWKIDISVLNLQA
ncbi:MAG: hypothetical protein WC824_14615 [Bacteroidota bacterium]